MKKAPFLLSSILISAALAGCAEKEASSQPEVAAETIDLQNEVDAYKQFAIEQMNQFVVETEKFTEAVKSGDIETAKAIYPQARMYFERSEPIAESFGDLDPRIDARLADIEEAGQGEEDWSGYHKIEYGLWVENTTEGYEEVADQLLVDTKELRARVETVEVTPDLMMTGAVDLLNEVSTSKITGEEEIFSHTDLYDFQANVEGAEKIFHILEPEIEKKDAALTEDLQAKFDALYELLDKHATGEDGFVSYEELTSEDTKQLAEAVNQLGEPLSRMGIIME
ncbi:iron uptake system protein EfeO [Planococcus kocurii]|uniref:Iron ABC transporter substrate-binding protein n=1 Tax=Planococcus kocurii TaxID=1374 RepID=A0ABM5WZ31_9BACL|nr:MULTISPECIES: iron uptake system protein EfeO [Planococcus]ALS79517.1 iron ABC transporter substrate-binding protein [Planococcus kocurii]KAA0956970.1 EfeM/EfeO family lipoprotein [Planococcus sp. ANT_H30]